MRVKQVKKLPKGAVKVVDPLTGGELFFTEKYIYEEYTNCFGEKVYCRHERRK